ncbi:hypothetical protein A2U01_0114271, partial [Trifolium medium]|nr:hypothetical protein [Trifolium medium]
MGEDSRNTYNQGRTCVRLGVAIGYSHTNP